LIEVPNRSRHRFRVHVISEVLRRCACSCLHHSERLCSMHITANSVSRLIATASIGAMLIAPQSILAGQLSPGAADAGLPRSLSGAVPDQRIISAPAMIRIEGMDLLAAPGALAPSAARPAGAHLERNPRTASSRKPAATASASGLAESGCSALASISSVSRSSQMLGTSKAAC